MVPSSEGLEVDESLLTGEAESIVKNVNDRVLSGSIVVAGEGYVRTGAVGVNAYAHSITAQVKCLRPGKRLGYGKVISNRDTTRIHRPSFFGR